MDKIEEVRARFKVFLEENREMVDRMAEANTIRDAKGRCIGFRGDDDDDDDFEWETLYPELFKKK